ncbi:hypothetical protein M426DRAFT_318776 [Hypoxylon sp. CI-4A]|nr:hypothetical protein M426DRAFT_318776 [Hypoxylon sp. CI-4A]
MSDLPGSALVTGAGSGIPKAVAIGFAKRGSRGVVVADIDLEAAKKTAAEAKAAATNPDFRAEGIQIDVSSEDSVKNAINTVVKLFGRFDYCVNGARVAGELKDFVDTSLDGFRQAVDVNITGTYLVVKYATAAMASQELIPVDPALPGRGGTRGSIVTMASSASITAFPKAAAYVAGKHAEVGLTRSAALDNIKHSIRVNTVCAGNTDIWMLKQIFPEHAHDDQHFLSQIPAGRLGLPEEIADVFLFLSSPSASFVNGSSINVDGGRL